MTILDPSPDAEGGDGGSKEDETTDYSTEMERLLCDKLAIDNEQSELERKQRRGFGYAVVPIAGLVPLLALGILFYVMVRHPAYFFLMDALPQAVLISASFLSMVVIYSFLIKGMFQSTSQDGTPSALKEILEVVRSLGGKE